MSEQIGIVAAMPGELLPLVRGWERVPEAAFGAKIAAAGVSAWRMSKGGQKYVAVCAGMGAAAATRAFARVRELMEPTLIVSAGWAGALATEMEAGAVIRPRTVLDARTGERFAGAEAGPLLVTLGHIADVPEKMRLRATYAGAVAVDMEAATLARLSAAGGYAFRAIKAISDDAHARLPDMNPFVTERGQFRMARFVGHVGMRPQHWASLAGLGRNARLAANRLARAIEHDFELESEP